MSRVFLALTFQNGLLTFEGAVKGNEYRSLGALALLDELAAMAKWLVILAYNVMALYLDHSDKY